MATNTKTPGDPGADRLAGASPLQRDLARRILEKMRDEGWTVGTRVSEQDLARAFGVSRSPIRAALDLLAAQGIVAALEKRGLGLARDVASLDIGALVPSSPQETLYETMMRDRATGQIPQEISEAELMPRYGVSRGVIRKLLMRFAAEGLAQRMAGHGWRFVDSLDDDEAYRESYEFRLIVECAALRSPRFVVDREKIEPIRRAHQRILADDRVAVSGEEWFRVNAAFHETLAMCSRNRFLLQTVRHQNSLRRMREHSVFSELPRERIEQSCREHLAIIDALEAEDFDWAESLLRHHLRLAADF
ncbi:GntR family transcriptional regulator [Microbaculum marinum]|uniref:GntR family transcriptional regulator n=1 Tax=Microbaculum marinum TaxID=1764581 RepID=A0AAW9S3J6_9HYPH